MAVALPGHVFQSARLWVGHTLSLTSGTQEVNIGRKPAQRSAAQAVLTPAAP